MTDKVVSQIFETTDYKKFSPLKENRGAKESIKPERVKKILKIIASSKFTPEKFSMQVTKDFKIINGHHSHAAAQIAKIPIRYEIFADPKFYNGDATYVNNVYNINAMNTAWSPQDVFKAAVASKQHLATEIVKLISKHNNTFDYLCMMSLIMRDPKIMKRPGGIDVLTYGDKELVKYFDSGEFSLELASFIKINHKLRIVSEKKKCLANVYEVIYYARQIIDPLKFRNCILKISDATLNNTSKTKDSKSWFKVLVSHYNSSTGSKVHLKTLLKAVKSKGKDQGEDPAEAE